MQHRTDSLDTNSYHIQANLFPSSTPFLSLRSDWLISMHFFDLHDFYWFPMRTKLVAECMLFQRRKSIRGTFIILIKLFYVKREIRLFPFSVSKFTTSLNPIYSTFSHYKAPCVSHFYAKPLLVLWIHKMKFVTLQKTIRHLHAKCFNGL